MIDVSISTAESGAKKVRLGKQGENGVRKIIFDLQSMVNRYGDGLATLVFQRNGDTAPYVVTATREENSLVWIVSSTDTAKAGPGRAEIRWFVDGALAKTVIFATETIASLVEDTEMPDVMQTWYDQMIDYVDAQPQIVIGEVQRMIDGKADAATVDNVYAKKTDIPTKLSKFTNDAGFITEIPEGYVTDTELEDVRSSLSAMIGSPLVAASAADMTDTDRVYVYTGAETGYENGDWYYYDSGISQWRSGGVYNSTAVTTDKTLSVENSAADAKATGDAIDSLNEDITNLETNKQDALTFDQTPTAESTNPVTSVGIKNAIEAAVDVTAPGIYETASGSIASFADGADDLPMKSAVVSMEPIQEGTGDPSPENVRPISGRTGLNVVTTGKNLLPITVPSNAIAGTFGSSSTNIETATNARIFAMRVPKNTDLFIQKITGDTTSGGIALCDTGSIAIGTPIVYAAPFSGSANAAINTGDHGWLCITTSSQQYTENWWTTRELMISVGTARQEYVAPSGYSEVSVNLETEAGTVYGGLLDVVSGKLTVDRVKVSKTWGELTNASTLTEVIRKKYALSAAPKYITVQANGDLICNLIKTYSTSYTQATVHMYIGDANNAYVFLPTGTDDSTVVELSYILAEPVEYQLSANEIRTLLGENNIWSDGGDISVEYPADTKLYIDQKITEAIAAAMA